MQFKNDTFEIEILDIDQTLPEYDKTYVLGEKLFNNTGYGIAAKDATGQQNTCLLSVSGGRTRFHPNSIVLLDKQIFIAIGNWVCCLELSSLELLWHKKVDTATSFGIYLSPDNDGIIFHGEVDITKMDFEGNSLWSVSGKDIFTEGFSLHENCIEVIDFNNEKYRINLDDGQIALQ